MSTTTCETKTQRANRLADAGAKMARSIETRRVAGSGGRMRTVAVCEAGCWHGNHQQALQCKTARIVIAEAGE